MPHEMYYVKNKSRAERRTMNLLHKQHYRMIKALKKLRRSEATLLRTEPVLAPRVMKVFVPYRMVA